MVEYLRRNVRKRTWWFPLGHSLQGIVYPCMTLQTSSEVYFNCSEVPFTQLDQRLPTKYYPVLQRDLKLIWPVSEFLTTLSRFSGEENQQTQKTYLHFSKDSFYSLIHGKIADYLKQIYTNIHIDSNLVIWTTTKFF